MTQSTELQLTPDMIGLFGEMSRKLDALDTDQRKRLLQALGIIYSVESPREAQYAQAIEDIRRGIREGWEEAKRVAEANEGPFALGMRSGSNTVAMFVYRALHSGKRGS